MCWRTWSERYSECRTCDGMQTASVVAQTSAPERISPLNGARRSVAYGKRLSALRQLISSRTTELTQLMQIHQTQEGNTRMSRPPETIPAPPPGVDISPIPNLSYEQASQFCKDVLGIPLSPRSIKDAAAQGRLRRHMLGGRSFVSTEAVWEMVMKAPSHWGGTA